MGRPLFSTLVAPAVRVAEPEAVDSKLPTYERWSDLNAFDPDSDEFFDGDNVVYEAFLTAEEIAEQEREQGREGEVQGEDAPGTGGVRVPVSSQTVVRRRVMERLANLEVPGEDERPELVSPTVGGSSSSGSDTASSGRASPDLNDYLQILENYRQQMGAPTPRHERERERADSVNLAPENYPVPGLTPPVSRSLPTSPIVPDWFDAVRSPPAPWAMAFGPVPDIPTPPSPMPQPAQAIPPSPMTTPGSATPRFLTWGNARGTRPRAIDMSPSPTPAGPFGSARASRMSLTYISPPALRVQP